MPLTPASEANRRGITAITLAMASFIVNDALIKYISEGLPAAQLIFLRGIFATLLLTATSLALRRLRPPAAPAAPGGRRQAGHKAVLWRSALDAFGTLGYLAALFHMPIGNAVAINSATPLFMTLFAAWMLREHVGPLRWMAIMVGFIGVLLVVQPAAEGFNAWALVCLLATLFNTARDLITRRIPTSVPSLVVTLAAASTVTVISGVMSLAQPWQAVSPTQFALLACASLFLSIAYFLVVVGMRHGKVSVVAPFRYASLIFALLIGWMVWGDVPNTLAWIGIVLLVGAGLVTLRRR